MANNRDFNSILNRRQPITGSNKAKARQTASQEVANATPVADKEADQKVETPVVENTETVAVVETVEVKEPEVKETVEAEIVEEQPVVKSDAVEVVEEPVQEEVKDKVQLMREQFLAKFHNSKAEKKNVEKFKIVFNTTSKAAFDAAYGETVPARIKAKLLLEEVDKAQVWALETGYLYKEHSDFNTSRTKDDYIKHNDLVVRESDKDFFELMDNMTEKKFAFTYSELYYSLLVAYWESVANA